MGGFNWNTMNGLLRRAVELTYTTNAWLRHQESMRTKLLAKKIPSLYMYAKSAFPTAQKTSHLSESLLLQTPIHEIDCFLNV